MMVIFGAFNTGTAPYKLIKMLLFDWFRMDGFVEYLVSTIGAQKQEFFCVIPLVPGRNKINDGSHQEPPDGYFFPGTLFSYQRCNLSVG